MSEVLAEDARMLTHDRQLFSGRTAIIRRLNAGMDQFLKMIGYDAPAAAVAAAAAVTGDDQPEDEAVEGGRPAPAVAVQGAEAGPPAAFAQKGLPQVCADPPRSAGRHL